MEFPAESSGPELDFEHLEQLKEQLGDPDAQVRKDAVYQLEHGVRPVHRRQLENWLKHRDPLVRNTARRGLDRLEVINLQVSGKKQIEHRRAWRAEIGLSWKRNRRAVLAGLLAGILMVLINLLIQQWRTIRDELDLRVGESLFFAGRPVEALASIEKFLATHPDHPGALARKIDVLMQSGRMLEVESLLLRLEAATDRDARYLRFGLKRMLREGRFAEGLKIFETLPETIVRDPQVRLEGLLTRWMAAAGNRVELSAIELAVAELVAEHPEYRGAQLLRAQLEQALGRTDIAMVRVNDLLVLQPRDAKSLALRGALHLSAGRYKLAEQDLEAALNAGESAPETRFNLALALEKQGRSADALYEYNQLLENVPEDPDTLLNRAVLHADAGDRHEEMKDYAMLNRLAGEKNPGLYFNAGLNRLEAGDSSAARRFFSRVQGSGSLQDQACKLLENIPESKDSEAVR